MRAIVQDRYGPCREVLHLREIPRPVPAERQVLVRVRATSVHADVWHAVTGIPYVLRLLGSGVRAPVTRIPGTDLAGEVAQVGAGVTRFAPGDRVFGQITPPDRWFNAATFAEYAAADEGLLAPIPDGLSFEQAAAVPTGALIALANLRDQGQVRSGQRVLVIGAGGAVGVWAVQLARVFGAQVTAVDAAAKLDLLRELGADHVLDYTREDVTRRSERYDLVFDVVSQARLSEVRQVIEPGGSYLMVGYGQYGHAGHRVLGSLGRMLRLQALAPFVPEIPPIRPGSSREEQWDTIVGLLASGRLRPVVDERTFPLELAADAIDYLASGVATGRVVLTV